MRDFLFFQTLRFLHLFSLQENKCIRAKRLGGGREGALM